MALTHQKAFTGPHTPKSIYGLCADWLDCKRIRNFFLSNREKMTEKTDGCHPTPPIFPAQSAVLKLMAFSVGMSLLARCMYSKMRTGNKVVCKEKQIMDNGAFVSFLKKRHEQTGQCFAPNPWLNTLCNNYNLCSFQHAHANLLRPRNKLLLRLFNDMPPTQFLYSQWPRVCWIWIAVRAVLRLLFRCGAAASRGNPG